MMEPGARIGPYEITALLGTGGMGEVYRARDAKLHRDVAIKVLPESVAGDGDRRARFEREAQALAALNHPSIAHVYGLEESALSTRAGQALAIVMELVEGPTLADLIAGRGRLPADEAIAIARQVADALDAAHTAGIVHRDLKPANIKVRPDGAVKVLDFGLAKMADPAGPATPDSPTFTSPAMTAHGVILGTAAYMAPEQARGHAADPRSDLWAFGVVLYEMLTGAPPFAGATVTDLMAAVLREPIAWDALPADTPPNVRRLLRRCLQRDPQQRLRSAGDARIELDDASAADVPRAVASAGPIWRWLLVGGGIACVAGLGVVMAGLHSARPADLRVRKWIIPQRYQGGGLHLGGRIPIISPDGSRVAYVDGAQLWIRDLNALASREVPIPADAGAASWPVFSPDGQFVAFAVARALDRVSLFRMPAAGGDVTRVSDLPAGLLWGLAWRPDGTIIANVAGKTLGLYRVEESGGNMRPMPVPGGGTALQLRGFRDGTLSYTHSDAKGVSLDFLAPDGRLTSITSDVLQVGFGSFWGDYSPTGHLLFVRGSERYEAALWAVPFEFDSRRVNGDPFRVAEFAEGASVSSDGTLVYQHLGHARMELAWLDRSGRFLTQVGQAQQMMLQPSISWDGSRAAVFGIDEYKRGIWIHDLARRSKSRLNLSDLGAPNNPAWQPGDARLSYIDGWTLQDVALEGSAPVNPLEGMDTGATFLASWSRDGRYLAFAGYRPDTRGDIWVLERGEKKARPVVETPAGETDPTLAPDARHVAYLSDETGRPELFVRTFPGGTDKLQITSNGAAFPTWSRRGDEIFFVQGHTLMTVPVQAGPPLRVGTPTRLFDLEEHAGRVRLYDTADGQRFLVVRTIEPWEQGIAVVQNWYEEFRR